MKKIFLQAESIAPVSGEYVMYDSSGNTLGTLCIDKGAHLPPHVYTLGYYGLNH